MRRCVTLLAPAASKISNFVCVRNGHQTRATVTNLGIHSLDVTAPPNAWQVLSCRYASLPSHDVAVYTTNIFEGPDRALRSENISSFMMIASVGVYSSSHSQVSPVLSSTRSDRFDGVMSLAGTLVLLTMESFTTLFTASRHIASLSSTQVLREPRRSSCFGACMPPRGLSWPV